MVQIDSITQQRIFALLRAALFGAEAEQSLFEDMPSEQWQAIYSIATRQGILAFTYDGVKSLPEALQPGLDIRVQWAYNVSHIEKLYERQLSVAQAIVATFSQSNIRTLILKGLSNASFYPKPSYRQSGDIDIYLMGDFERGNEIVRKKGGKVKHDYFVHSEFVIKGINIENHLHIVNPKVNSTGHYINEQLLQLAEQSVVHPTVKGALMPSATFNALFLLRHSSWHFARESIKLRDICDWAAFLTSSGKDIDIDKCMNMLRQSGLERYAAILTTLAVKYLGITSPLQFAENYEELSERVKMDILTFDAGKGARRGVIGTFIDKIRNRRARKWCYDLVVPDEYMGNIWFSVKGYLQNPLAIFKAKL